YGGEDFCILLTRSDLKDAEAVAERVRVAVEALHIEEQESGREIHITTSLGVSTVTDGADNLSQLIDLADKALYVSKDSGRNTVTVWKPGLESSGSFAELPRQHENAQALDQDEKPVESVGDAQEPGETLDTTTGLPDRGSFQVKLVHAIDYSKDNSLRMAVIVLDVDMFQRLNFALGHATGDRILRILAERLGHSLRDTDTVNLLAPDDMNHGIFRLGGDEFGVLLTGMHSSANVPTVVNRIIKTISEPVMIEGQEVFLTCGAGISLYPRDGDSADKLVTNAGLALKQAKRSGVGKCRFYDADYASLVRKDYQVESVLRYAIDNGELELYFQPKFDINSLRIDSMEALIRWNHPETGLRYPGEFINAAEASGLINPMGKWVMDAACRHVRKWLDEGYEIPVSINLSPVQFRQQDLIEQINDAVAAAKIDPRLIELEITENAIMEDVDAAMATMHTLSQFGYKISIDDFGIGYSSLEHLKRYPLDILKIDRCFVQEIDLGESELAIARAIVEMSHSMGLRVVAEGVETESQLLALREIHCDLVQGFLLGVPLPARDAIKLVNENSDKLTAIN
ncbi:MAG: bifunctional diguanylate cyclase/phosphodiesterase, partial [Gammaproteobacteria bacterium]